MFKVKMAYMLIIIGTIMIFISGLIFIYVSYIAKELNIERIHSVLKEMGINISKEAIYDIINIMKFFGVIHIVLAIMNSISIIGIYGIILKRVNVFYIIIFISSIIGLISLAGFFIGPLLSIIGSILGIIKRNCFVIR